MSTVGWYVHHHGAGHLMRFLAIRPHLDADVVVLSSLPAPAALPPRTRWVTLERDDDPVTTTDGARRDPRQADPSAGGALHWAPRHHPGHRARLATIATTVAQDQLAAFVVDVSVEVAVLVRLLGTPLVLMMQPGVRDDDPHRLAFSLADARIASWPAGRPDPLGNDVVEVGGISRFEGRARTSAPIPGRVLLLGGGAPGDHAGSPSPGAPGLDWHRIGGPAPWVADPWTELCEAEVVVSSAGQNAVADLAAVGARAVVIAQERPFSEQRATAEVLREHGLAVVVDAWPADREWPALLEAARHLEPRWERWRVRGAARRAADVVAGVVGDRA